MEKNLNLVTNITLLYRNFYQYQSKINLNLMSGYLNSTKFPEKNLNEWKVYITLGTFYLGQNGQH